MTESVETQLLHLFDKLFQKQYLEKNIYIFNQMKPNLEIPVSLIFKERKIVQVTADEDLILRTLRKCNRVTVTEDGKICRIHIPITKTKLTVQADNKTMEQLSLYVETTLFSGYRYDMDKNLVIIHGNDETQVANLKNALEKQPGFTCTLENSDPYFDLKDSIDKAKFQKKERANYEAYQQSGGWAAQNMYAYNPYAGKYERPRGAGYTRRAVQSSDQEDNIKKEKKKQPEVKEEKKEKQPEKVHDKPHGKEHGKDHHKEKHIHDKGHDKTKQSPTDKKPKYREKQPEHKEQKSEIEKRTRLNSENFPAIEKEIQKQVLRVKYTKAEIVDIYIKEAPNIPISPELKKSQIPLINIEGVFKLEAMKPGGRKESTFDTPKVIIVPRKSSTAA